LEIVAASSALFKNQVATESHGPIPSPLATVKGRSFFGCCQRVETVARAFLATPGISPQKAKKKKKKNQNQKKLVRKIAERIPPYLEGGNKKKIRIKLSLSEDHNKRRFKLSPSACRFDLL
jgi:hypothetical protein